MIGNVLFRRVGLRNGAILTALAAESLELQELGQGTEIDGVGSGFVAAEDIVVVGALDHGVGEGRVVGEGFVLVEVGFEEGELGAVGALDAVEGGGDLGDQQEFLDADGLVLGDQLGAQHFVGGAVLDAGDLVG
jgi:hypothetical protein